MSIFIDSAGIAYKAPIVIGKRLLKFAKGVPSAARQPGWLRRRLSLRRSLPHHW